MVHVELTFSEVSTCVLDDLYLLHLTALLSCNWCQKMF